MTTVGEIRSLLRHVVPAAIAAIVGMGSAFADVNLNAKGADGKTKLVGLAPAIRCQLPAQTGTARYCRGGAREMAILIVTSLAAGGMKIPIPPSAGAGKN